MKIAVVALVTCLSLVAFAQRASTSSLLTSKNDSLLESMSSVESVLGALQPHSDNEIDLVKHLNALIAINLLPRTISGKEHASYDVPYLLKSGWAHCGVREIILAEVLAQVGVKTRRVGFKDVPYQRGHTATEVLIDGKWKFFDSSFGVYFTKRGETQVLSLAEARTHYPDVDAHVPTLPAWSISAHVISDLSYKILDQNVINWSNPTGYTRPVANIQRTYFISETTGISSASYDDQLTYFDLTGKNIIELGQIDESASDILAHNSFGAAVHVPVISERIGMYHSGNIRQTYMMKTDTPADVTFTVHFLTDSDLSRLFWDIDHYASIPGDSYHIESTTAPKSVALKFKVQPPFSTLRLSAPWNKDIHYIDQISINSSAIDAEEK